MLWPASASQVIRATGLKDASMFDLTGNQNAAQQKDRLLPLLRCESRLKEMRKNAASLVS